MEILALENSKTERDLGVLVQPLPIFIVEKTVSENPSDLLKVTQLENRTTRARALWFFYYFSREPKCCSGASIHPWLTLLPKPQQFFQVSHKTNFGFLLDSASSSEKYFIVLWESIVSPLASHFPSSLCSCSGPESWSLPFQLFSIFLKIHSLPFLALSFRCHLLSLVLWLLVRVSWWEAATEDGRKKREEVGGCFILFLLWFGASLSVATTSYSWSVLWVATPVIHPGNVSFLVSSAWGGEGFPAFPNSGVLQHPWLVPLSLPWSQWRGVRTSHLIMLFQQDPLL